MGRIHLYTAISLDGYISDGSGSVAWLDDFMAADYGFDKFIGEVNTIILGRVTYEQVLGFGEWPYAGKRAWVLTRDASPLAGGAPAEMEFFKGDVRMLANEIGRSAGGDAWLVGGARTNAQFLQHGLIDVFHLAVMPITLGRGLPVFTPVEGSTRFDLAHCTQFDNGVVMMRYHRQGLDQSSRSEQAEGA